MALAPAGILASVLFQLSMQLPPCVEKLWLNDIAESCGVVFCVMTHLV
jgi:hypothetical protein